MTHENQRQQWDVIVVGSGLGGLSCAGLLSKNGKKVLILEKHKKVGGYAHQFKRKAGHDIKYHFDVALHVTGAMDEGAPSRRILEEIGVWDRIRVKRLDIMYRSSFPDFEITVPADKELFRQKLCAQFPQEAVAINSLFKTVETFANEMAALLRAVVPGEPPQSDFAEKYPTLSKYMVATLHDLVSDHVSNEKLSAVFCQLWPYVGLPPKRVSAFLYLQMWLSFFTGGAYYIQGGGYALSQALAGIVEERGGKVLTKTEVSRILVENGRCSGVETANGEKFKAPIIVSNAPAPVTFGKLIDTSLVDPSYMEQVQNTELSISIIQAYIGVKGTPKEIGFEDDEYFMNMDYDAEGQFDRMLKGDYSNVACVMANNTAVNPGDTPPGRSIIEIAILADGKQWCDLPHEEYRKKKAEVTELLVDKFSEVIPDIRDRIEVIEVGTPHTMRRYTGNPCGAVYGYASTPSGHSIFRPRPDTPVPGLYLASAWTFPGPGFGGTLAGGANTAAIILRKE
ncbi:NAD(P)/FAD-dependent oxidoreductase [Candidatus Poribacteria bacterium]|nr:NAD(P)/FAD-dependent oxidoreductase [Candidatus Poribacteria bacterium]